MFRYNFYDKVREKHGLDNYLQIMKDGRLQGEDGKSCDEAFESAYRKIMENMYSYPNPKKWAAFQALSLRAIELAWIMAANITINVEGYGVGLIRLETDMLLMTRHEDKKYVQTLGELFTTSDHILYFTPDNALPRIEFTYLLYDLIYDLTESRSIPRGMRRYKPRTAGKGQEKQDTQAGTS